MFRPVAIAIDGPAGAGKSTVSRELARQTGFDLLDTGAMYRAYTWAMLQSPAGVGAPVSMLTAHQFQVVADTEGTRVICDGQDISAAIRSAAVTGAVSAVAELPAVRALAVAWQQQFVRDSLLAGRGVILEGRDIGTVVLPAAERKFFLTADLAARAERRAGEEGSDPAEVLSAINARDEWDSNREHSPLRPAADAILIDSTGLSVAEVVARMLAELGQVDGA